jgi:hypothetical protein
VELQILVDAPNRMLARRGVGWQIGGKNEYRRLPIALRNAGYPSQDHSNACLSG